MSLIAGSRLGPYEVLSRIGAGGMGEVYCAKDTKLDRQVAIKVLPDAVAQDPQRLARFEREAKVLASLNHPNIAQIYGIEHQALVMELVEGQTLKGPLPRETALDYAKQIALALEAAHDKGITHRDLKPANVMITPAGVVKVLDFGLAAVSHDDASAPVDAENSPTLSHATQAGVIMGTAAYMSPEQASGKPVDKRSDIWSFGVVLYEMLTGKRLFEGETVSHTMAAILAKEPELGRLPAGIRPLVERCLRKDPRKRWRDIGDVRMALDEPMAETPARPRGVRIWQTIAAVLVLGIVAALLAPWRRPVTAASPFIQLDLDVGPDSVAQPAISPDGSVVVFVSKNRLVMRRLDQNTNTALPGTEGASFPFFSPNGESVAFFADGKIKRIALQGGAPTPVCDIATNRGASWGEDGFIIAPMVNLGGLSRIPVAGGEPQPLTSTKDDPEGMGSHRWPQVLPGGKGVLFAATSGIRGSLRVLQANGGTKTLVQNSTYGRYLPSGHLIYYQSGGLFAATLSLDSLDVGPPVALVERVGYTANIANADFAAAASGTLVYVRGTPAVGRVVSWLDSAGKVTPILAKPAQYNYLKLSPDEKRLAFVLTQEGGKTDLWVYDLVRETPSQITFDGGTKGYPVWTRDGEFIVFTAVQSLAWIRADGSGKIERLEVAMERPFPWSLSSDGARLAFGDATGVRTVSVERTPAGLRLGQPEPSFQTGDVPAISPDDQLLAYSSTQSGRNEVYVRSLPGPAGTGQEPTGRRWPISNDGGTWPIWPRSRRELLYIGPDRRIRAAAYTIEGEFVAGKVRVWSEKVLSDVGLNPSFDMESSGKRAVVLIDPGGPESKPETHLRILLNLDEELARRIAALRKP